MSQLAEFIGNHLWLSLAFIAVLFMYLSITLNEKMQAFSNVDTSQLTQLVNHKDAVVIDTRSADDFDNGHIVNAINMPLADIIAGGKSIDKLKGKTVITYCVSGMLSKTACKHLIKSGVSNVFNLTGGINSWVGEKLPLVK
ncbi:MAG: rhodanese-like domain-containing protein [Proteobacteria bacterium]|nr:rhodanese-like domain-containing protein [Pseudomonadota bacterium]